MAARLVSDKAIADACNELVSAGEQPTTTNVYKILGKGSYSTIGSGIAIWKESDAAKDAQASQLPAVSALPDEFLESGQILLKKIFHLAEQQHAAKVEKIRMECDHSVAVEQAEVKQALGYAETANEEKDDLTKELDEAKEKIASLDETIGNLKGRLTDSERTNSKLDSSLNESNEEIKRLTNLVAKSETDIALLKQETEQSKAALNKAEATHKQAISDLKSDHNAEIKSIKDDHSHTVLDLKKWQEKAISDLKSDHNTEIQSLKDNNNQAISELKSDQVNVIKDIKADNATATKALIAATNKTIDISEKATLEAQKQRDEANQKIAELEKLLADKTPKERNK